MAKLSYIKHERIWLKSNPEFHEKWLQDQIQADPSILGLGEVIVRDRERVQARAGRLDLLLSDLEGNRRYEVELMLGPTDESHIIRCIEYWDIERRRYPGYEHCAVLVAEDITSRFLNVIALLAGTVPLIAIQVNALKVNDHILLDFVRVLDQRQLRRDDEEDTNLVSVDRSYWVEKSTKDIVALADAILAFINAKATTTLQLNYNKHYIGLTDGIRSRNFVVMNPRKKYLRLVFKNAWTEERASRFDGTDLDAGSSGADLSVNVTAADLKKYSTVVETLIHEIVIEQQS